MAPNQFRFLALGDSYTIGENVSPDQRWPNQLVKLLSTNGKIVPSLTVIAQTGWTTCDLLASLNQAELTGSFDLVSLLIGVNNQFDGLGIEEYRHEFRSLIQQSIGFAGGDPTRLFVLSIPDWGKTPFADDRDRSQIRREIGAFNGVNWSETMVAGSHYVDIAPVSQRALSDSSLLGYDKLHPSGKMYAAWVELIYPVAQQILQNKFKGQKIVE
jgi:lysophospholipase L1-like esterase